MTKLKQCSNYSDVLIQGETVHRPGQQLVSQSTVRGNMN